MFNAWPLVQGTQAVAAPLPAGATNPVAQSVQSREGDTALVPDASAAYQAFPAHATHLLVDRAAQTKPYPARQFAAPPVAEGVLGVLAVELYEH